MLLVGAMMVPISTFPTCIVIVRSKFGIFVAADSKRVGRPEAVCKIRHIGRYYYGVAGTFVPIYHYVSDSILNLHLPIHRAEKMILERTKLAWRRLLKLKPGDPNKVDLQFWSPFQEVFFTSMTPCI